MLISEPDVSKATKEGDLPPRLGLKVLNGEGQQVGEIATCTGLHGEASSAGMVAFGCKEGVLIARRDGSGMPEVEMLPYGDDMPEGRSALYWADEPCSSSWATTVTTRLP